MTQARSKKLGKRAHVGADALGYFRQREAEDPAFAAAAQDARDKRQLAHRIRELRESKGLSQAEVAEQIGTKQPSIARIERGLALPRLDMLQKLARVFGMRVQIEFVPTPKRRRRKSKAADARETEWTDEARASPR
jgi:ribosome-binding protein aMBF1 (putative translation factor)